jgi:hypothetical protein
MFTHVYVKQMFYRSISKASVNQIHCTVGTFQSSPITIKMVIVNILGAAQNKYSKFTSR